MNNAKYDLTRASKITIFAKKVNISVKEVCKKI